MTEYHAQGIHANPCADVPRYIRVKFRNTGRSQFKGLFLAQQLISGRQPGPSSATSVTQIAIGNKILSDNNAAIWTAEFSSSGRYLAVAGRDQVIRVFKVISTEEERAAQKEDEKQAGAATEIFSAPVFRSTPIREFKGHIGDVLSLSWSKNDFLLSCSTDKTVRLWHPSQPISLRTFQHDKTVTSVAFHPIDDRFFLSGSFDTVLRLWSIPDSKIAYSSCVRDVITAVAFTPSGKGAICGSFNGTCIFFDTVGLKEKNQIYIWPSHAKSEKGAKITGIQTVLTNGQVKVMITTNDSQIRVYDLAYQGLTVKLEGLKNQSSQIHARFNDDGEYVICGGEDDKVHLWRLGSYYSEFKDQLPHEIFGTESEVVTNAVMAPTATRQLLSASGDPVYDLCNPPSAMSRSLQWDMARRTSTSNSLFDDADIATAQQPRNATYVERCRHPDGNIIIATDNTGKVKVYRQDCSFKRRYGVPEGYTV